MNRHEYDSDDEWEGSGYTAWNAFRTKEKGKGLTLTQLKNIYAKLTPAQKKSLMRMVEKHLKTVIKVKAKPKRATRSKSKSKSKSKSRSKSAPKRTTKRTTKSAPKRATKSKSKSAPKRRKVNKKGVTPQALRPWLNFAASYRAANPGATLTEISSAYHNPKYHGNGRR